MKPDVQMRILGGTFWYAKLAMQVGWYKVHSTLETVSGIIPISWDEACIFMAIQMGWACTQKNPPSKYLFLINGKI